MLRILNPQTGKMGGGLGRARIVTRQHRTNVASDSFITASQPETGVAGVEVLRETSAWYPSGSLPF
jgi:hypothetical protein